MPRRKSQAPPDISPPPSTGPSTPLPIAETDVSTPVDPPSPSAPSTPLPVHTTVKRKRGRPSRAALEERRLSTPMAGDGDDPSDGHGTPSYVSSTRGKRRGRPPATGSRVNRNRGGPSHYTQIPLDKDGNPQEVEGDEIVIPDDPRGEEKVDKDGHLLGSREYRCRTFTILGRGERLYMLSTEPARCIGFRDSYLFFQKHKQLFKIIVDDDEKYDMIARELIPHSYKGRAIGVVTARSVFREFGARIIVGGRKIIDDYFEDRERAAGAIEGELAEPTDVLPKNGEPYNRNQYVAWHGASAVYHTGQPSVPAQQQGQQVRKKKVIVTESNWMLEHARAASQFNNRLYQHRALCHQGVYEPHTNLMFYPSATQPTAVKWEVLPASKRDRGQTIVEEAFREAPFVGNGLGVGVQAEYLTGYGDWDDSVLEALETEEEREAVRAQMERERGWRESLFA